MAGETEAGRCDPGARFTPLPGEVEGHAFPDCYPARVLSQGERQLGLVSFTRSCQPPRAQQAWGSERRLEFCFVVYLPFYCFSLWWLWVFVSMLGLSLAAASRGRSLAVKRRLQAHGPQYLGVCT